MNASDRLLRRVTYVASKAGQGPYVKNPRLCRVIFIIMKNKETANNLAYDLILGKLTYQVLESAKLIYRDDFKKYFNPKGIKFSVEMTVKLSFAQLQSVKVYLSENGTKDVQNWFENTLKESTQYRDLRGYYLNILIRQLKEIQYKKWKAMDRYLSFMSLRNGL